MNWDDEVSAALDPHFLSVHMILREAYAAWYAFEKCEALPFIAHGLRYEENQ